LKDHVLVQNLFWKRTYLFIEYISDTPIRLALENKSDKKKLYLFYNERLNDHIYRAKLNIVIADGINIAEASKYRIINAETSLPVSVSDEIIVTYEDHARIFKYSENNYSYLVNFFVFTHKGTLCLGLETCFMMLNKHPKKRHILLESKNLQDTFTRTLKYSAAFLLNIYYKLVVLFYNKSKKNVLFMSENRFKISENLKAIDYRLKERNLTEQFNISYSFRNIYDKKYTIFSWLKLTALIAKQNYIFLDDYTNIFSFLNLNKKTKLIQTWHAGFGFKLVGYGRFGITGSPHPYISSHRKYTFGLVGCNELKELYSEVWGVATDSLIASGLPRLDHFLEESIQIQFRQDFHQRYPMLSEKRIILFAPTYRGYDQKSASYDYSKIDYDKLAEFCLESKTVIIFKMHHFIQEPVPIPEEYKRLMFEVKDININDLFYITDILITDYSSCFYDFALLKKPILFYVYDKTYYEATRGVHRPIEKVAPGKICKSFDSLLKALKEQDFEIDKLDNFFVDKCFERGKLASDIVIDTILLKETT